MPSSVDVNRVLATWEQPTSVRWRWRTEWHTYHIWYLLDQYVVLCVGGDEVTNMDITRQLDEAMRVARGWEARHREWRKEVAV